MAQAARELHVPLACTAAPLRPVPFKGERTMNELTSPSPWGHAAFDMRAEDRVRRHTAPHVNAKIDRDTALVLQETVRAGRDAMVARMRDLDHEWDVDRALIANFAIVGALTSELGRRYRGFKYFFRAQQAFLLMHAVMGWCPPMVVFRRLGFRTAKEIAQERAALMDELGYAPADASGASET
jgi:hypothetical protein